MILVFKTSVSSYYSLEKVRPFLNKLLPNTKWNFDLEDGDHILRIESQTDVSATVISSLQAIGFDCEELE